MRILTLALICAAAFLPSAVAADAPKCSAAKLSGTYTFANSGNAVYDGLIYFFAGAGIIKADGNGKLEGKDTTSTNGYVERRTWTGNYTVNEDCTGTVEMAIPGMIGHFDIVVSSDGKKIRFIQTDSGTIVSGTAERQDLE